MANNPHIIKPEEKAFMKAMVFAPHGRGKTTFLGTAQEDERTAPMLLLDFEGNTEVLVGLDIDIWPVRNHDDFTEAYSFLKKGGHGYKSVAIDSISEVSTYYLLSEMERRVALGGPGRNEYPDQAQLQDYGVILVQLRRLLRMYRDLPMHVIYTAMDFLETEPGEGSVKKPSIQGNMRNEVGGLLSVVGYLALDEKEKDSNGEHLRVMMLRDIPRMRVKARTGWKLSHTIPKVLENPTVGRLLDVVYPTLKVVKDQKTA